MPPTAPASGRDHLVELTSTIHDAENYSAVREALRAGHSAALDGAWGSSAALAVAAVTADNAGPVLSVIAHPGDIDIWASDLSSFSGVRPPVFPALESLTGEKHRVDAATTPATLSSTTRQRAGAVPILRAA